MLIEESGPKLISPLAQQGHLSFELSEQRQWAYAKGTLSGKELTTILLFILFTVVTGIKITFFPSLVFKYRYTLVQITS